MSEIIPPDPSPSLPPAISQSTIEYYRPGFRSPEAVWQARAYRPRYWLHALLLLATIFTTLVVGVQLESNFQRNLPTFSVSNGQNNDAIPFFPLEEVLRKPSLLRLGIPFSATLMLILMAHEMGHYLYCRYYKVEATLPFFIPAPTLIGTLGAFIRIRAPIRSRSALFDIGIAGPIAGFVVAVTVLCIALPLSHIARAQAPQADIVLGYPLIFRLAWYLLPLPALKAGAAGLSAVNLHPIAIAAWVGMFATALNLLPGGQLDGGLIVFSIAPRKHRWVSNLTIIALIPLAIYLWVGWILWAVLLRITAMRHPMVPEWPGVNPPRKALAVLALIMLILTLSPAPFAHNSLVEVVRQLRSGP